MCLSKTLQLRVQRRCICLFFILFQGCTDSRRQVAMAPNIYGFSVWNLLLAPRILRWLLHFSKNLDPCTYLIL